MPPRALEKMRVIWYICRQIATHRLNWKKKSVLPISSSFLALTWRKMEDELHPRSELYYRQQARPIPPIPDLGVADMEAFRRRGGFPAPWPFGTGLQRRPSPRLQHSL
eukprot:g9007.t1